MGKTQREAKAILLDGDFKQLPSLRSAPRPRKKKEPDDATGSIRESVIWTYHNIADLEVKASDAPSMGAWGLLQWARTDPKTFYSSYLRLLVPTKDADKDVSLTDDGKLITMLSRVREAAGKHDKNPHSEHASGPPSPPPQTRLPESAATSAT